MARPKKIPQEEATTEATHKALNPQDTPERWRMGELGHSGLTVFSGVTNEELSRELTFPNSIRTYKQMQTHSAVNACLSLYDNLISKVVWRVVPPPEATEEEKNQTKFINECLEDMDIPLRQVIRDSLSSNVFGFAVQEKVYRRRTKASGSMYQDNKIGIKKIALRNQESIQNFIFDDYGNEVIGVKQGATTGTRGSLRRTNEVVIPRSKFILITSGRNRNDPYGKSPLRDVYMSWRYLEVLQELEAQGVQKDLVGVPIFRVPSQIMSVDASPEQKKIFDNIQNVGRNLQAGSQSAVILPSQVDEATRAPLFDLALLSNEGGKKNFDIDKIKQYYLNQIYTAMFADILYMGSTTTGSYALGNLKSTLTGAAVESMLDNITSEFNRDLIRQLYELNGWDASRACRLDYEGLHNADLESVSRFLQRTASVNLIEKDRSVLNFVRTSVGLDSLPDDAPVPDYLLAEGDSKAGKGMDTPFEGTRTQEGGQNDNDNNLENV